MLLTLWLMRLAVAAVIWLLDKLTNRIRTKAQPQPVPQEPPLAAAYVPSAPPPSPTMAVAAPDVHVHVHIAPEAQRSSAPASAPTLGAAAGATILGRPDDRIYITTGSHLMMEHPDSERLLDSLDHMLYVAAHRNGKPFHLTPLDGVTTRKWRICPTFKNVSGIQVGLTVDVVAFSALRAS